MFGSVFQNEKKILAMVLSCAMIFISLGNAFVAVAEETEVVTDTYLEATSSTVSKDGAIYEPVDEIGNTVFNVFSTSGANITNGTSTVKPTLVSEGVNGSNAIKFGATVGFNQTLIRWEYNDTDRMRFEKGVEYTVEFKVKKVSGTLDKVYAGMFYNWPANYTFTDTYTDSDLDTDGWTTLKFSACIINQNVDSTDSNYYTNGRHVFINFVASEGLVVLVDDISVYATADAEKTEMFKGDYLETADNVPYVGGSDFPGTFDKILDEDYEGGDSEISGVEGDFNYTVQDGNATITGYTGESAELVIPSVLGGYPVTSIGDSAFYSCSSPTSVVIPNGVTSIGSYAFSGCVSLKNVVIPNTVTDIGNSAFYTCDALTEINIPDSVISIGDYAFYNCDSLTDINIPDSVTNIGSNAFDGCTSIASITLPNSITDIAEYTFSWCKSLKSITIPGSVKSIGEGAFSGCTSLESVTLPKGIENINTGAFDSTVLTDVYFCGFEEEWQSVIIDGANEPLEDANIHYNSHNFGEWEIVTESTCTEEGEKRRVCSLCGAEEWGIVEFDSHTYSDEFTVDKEPTLYEEGSKSRHCVYCDSVIDITVIPATSKANGTCGENAVWALSEDGVLYIEGSGEMYSYSYNTMPWYNYLEEIFSINLEDGITLIGDNAFYDCSSLTNITIPNSVTMIGSCAFWNCSSLTSVNIPQGVFYIGNSAFYNCKSFTSITIPSSLTNIGDGAFEACSSIESITVASENTVYHSVGNCLIETVSKTLIQGSKNSVIPNDDSVIIIGKYSFSGYTELRDITIPKSITSIGELAFFGCTSLTDIFYCGTETEWGNINIALGNDLLTSANINYHKYGEWEIITESTCTEEGEKRRICILCGAEEWGVVEFSSHTYSEEFTVDKDPTLFEEGSKSRHCVYCDSVIDITVIPATSKANGTCGENAVWALSEDGVLYIEGSGEMDSAPWRSDYSETITSIVIGDGITSICREAFLMCRNIANITIGTGLSNIGIDAFLGVSLQSITVKKDNTTYYSQQNCLIEAASKTLVLGCNNSSVPTDTNVTTIGRYAFAYCDEIINITIPENIEIIDNGAFLNCTALESVVLPEGLTRLGRGVFERCSSLVSINIPKGITVLEGWTFNMCTSLKEIVQPEGITEIGDLEFSGCTSLVSITIPKSVTYMNESAFEYCPALKNVYIEDIEAWCKLPCGLSLIRDEYGEVCQSLNLYINGNLATDIVIPDTITQIGQSAFAGFSCIKSVVIPNSVTSIGELAFSGCTSLTDVYYCGTEEEWESISIGSYNNSLDSANINYHKYGEWVLHTEPTCTQDGWEMSVCSICGFGQYRNIQPSGHKYESVVTEPTCTEVGYTTYTCHCGYSYIDNEVEALGHSYSNEFTIDKEPTIFQDGSKSRHCMICDDTTDVTIIPALSKAHGTCGESAVWALTDDGVLHIGGSGATDNYKLPMLAPWYDYRAEITTVIIADTITKIGNNNFSCLTGITKAVFNNGNTEFGSYPFANGITFAIETEGGGSVEAYANEKGYAVIKAQNPQLPLAVEIELISGTMVKLKSVEGYEYSIDGENWQESHVFEELVPDTEYTFYQRITEGSYAASVKSEGLAVKTLSIPEAPVIESIVKNVATLTAIDGYEYSIDGINWQKSNVFNIPYDKIITFYQRTSANGIYDASPTSEGVKGISVSAPKVLVGECSIRVIAVEGYEYGLENMIWQDSNVFDEYIIPGETYVLQQRLKNSEGVFAVYDTVGTTVTVNGNEKITEPNADDLVWLRNLIMEADYINNLAADFNEDGIVDARDIVRLKKILAGVLFVVDPSTIDITKDYVNYTVLDDNLLYVTTITTKRITENLLGYGTTIYTEEKYEGATSPDIIYNGKEYYEYAGAGDECSVELTATEIVVSEGTMKLQLLSDGTLKCTDIDGFSGNFYYAVGLIFKPTDI